MSTRLLDKMCLWKPSLLDSWQCDESTLLLKHWLSEGEAGVRWGKHALPICIVAILGGGLEHGLYDFPYIGNVIIPTD